MKERYQVSCILSTGLGHDFLTDDHRLKLEYGTASEVSGAIEYIIDSNASRVIERNGVLHKMHVHSYTFTVSVVRE